MRSILDVMVVVGAIALLALAAVSARRHGRIWSPKPDKLLAAVATVVIVSSFMNAIRGRVSSAAMVLFGFVFLYEAVSSRATTNSR